MPRVLDSLPRLAELHDEFVLRHDVDNFFWHFPCRLKHPDSATFKHYQKIEQWLSYVPHSEWPKYRKRVGEWANQRHRCRYWEKLHDVFHEALGAQILKEEFQCEALFFEPELARAKSPDWLGVRNGCHVYAEVKTCNHSRDDCRSGRGEQTLHLSPLLPRGLRNKLTATYTKAVKQLQSPRDAVAATKVVVLVLNLDRNIGSLRVTDSALCAAFLREIEQPEFPIRFCLSS